MDLTIQSLRETKLIIRNLLSEIYDSNEANRITHLLIEYVCGLNTTQQILQSEENIKPEWAKELSKKLELLKNSEPLQYVISESEFYGRTFHVAQGVLIPRPETEELIEHCLEKLKDIKSPRILDLGTGSGAISITIAKEIEDSIVYASDISIDALKIAKQNAKQLNARVNFIEHDMLSDYNILPTDLDCIISNPPYIANKEKRLMNKNVLSFEPHSALFVPDDNPLLFYKRIAEIALTNLKTHGIVMCEINAAYSNETTNCFRKFGFGNIFVLKDIRNKNRMIIAEKL